MNNNTTLARELYGTLRLVATWLQQPTLIEVPAEIDVAEIPSAESRPPDVNPTRGIKVHNSTYLPQHHQSR
jgi:hypothetical protein